MANILLDTEPQLKAAALPRRLCSGQRQRCTSSMIKRASVFALMLIAAVGPCFAGGSLATEELDSLLKQQPEVREFLLSTLRLSDSAYAETRLGWHFEKLGGARMGPYSIRAKSIKDGRPIEVVLCTKTRFLDSKGNELPESKIESATRIDEKLIAVQLEKVDYTQGNPLCPAL